MTPAKVSTVINTAVDQLAAAGIESARLDAELLAAKVIGCSRTALIARKDDVIPPQQQTDFEALVKRRLEYEPVAYITGVREFYGREFIVNSAVLIPRPETELLVDLAIKYLQGVVSSGRPFAVIDLGCGSGAIGLTIAAELEISATLVDISTAALEVAKQNAGALGVQERVEFIESDLLEFLESTKVSANEELIVVANLPYISEAEELPKDVVNFEPRAALFAGSDGLREIGRLLQQAAAYRPKVRIFLEHGHGSRFAIKQLAAGLGFSTDEFDDLAGRERVIEVW